MLSAWRIVSLFVVTWGMLTALWPSGAHAQDRPVADSSRADSLQGKIVPRAADPEMPSLQEVAGGNRLDDAAAGTADTVAVDTALIDRYVPARRARGGLFDRPSPFVSPAAASEQGPRVTLDSSGTGYRVEGMRRTDGPMRLDSDTYRRQRQQASLRENWTTLLEQRQQQVDRSGLGVNMVVPGGRQSTFSTIFGKPEVDLRVNGQADIQAGFQYSKNDQQGARTGDATQIDPNFKQDLRLGITGTIGDKLQMNVDWDTNNQFDYQNQVKLEYTGYEDEIVQSVEAGNVFLETPSQLISGGQSLFGIKSQFQLGNLSFTTIASQQEGQSNSLSIEGGSESTEFDLQPTNYDEDTHFFLGYYFRNTWNEAHQDPTTITLLNGFDQITDVEVWKLRTSTGPNESDVRKAAAVVDLGEPPTLVREADGYTAQGRRQTSTLRPTSRTCGMEKPPSRTTCRRASGRASALRTWCPATSSSSSAAGTTDSMSGWGFSRSISACAPERRSRSRSATGPAARCARSATLRAIRAAPMEESTPTGWY